ncbi:Ytp1 family protein [Aspergillus lucknowensis]|uniref:Integral membrane protein n=1 Tax=Aspergillus lucknowensis TaxID=176173 RepID=A0ABR4LLZ1_9EURO
MWQHASRAALAALLLASLASALAHGDDHEMDMSMDMDMDMGSSHSNHTQTEANDNSPMSYFAYGKHTGWIVAHIALMVIAWCFVLPAAVMLSVARSRLALLSQFVFLVLNAVGLLVGIVYNSQTPDLYENNAHHKIGWIATWVIAAQVIMALIFAYAGRGEKQSAYERAQFLPVSTDEMADTPTYPTGVRHEYRWSRDSGQGTERNSASLHSRPSSPSCTSPPDEYDGFEKPEEEGPVLSESRGFMRSTILDRFLASRVPRLVSGRALRIMGFVYNVIDRLILQLGFIAITTGAVTYGGIFRDREIFNGLAHFIKGGIFFWYGLLTLGRVMGCWADLGWAWNVKPPQEVVGWKARIATGEFTESAVIFAYGISNVFLEHLSAWGNAWTATDFEHVSIAFMFLGGGLCGMLFESKRVKSWLNSTLLCAPSPHHEGHGPSCPTWDTPDTQNVSLNPMPAVVILLLGMMMGSHHQSSMVSSMVHKQWGNMLVGFALARGMTYVLMYLKPPTSYLPSRPPTEIVASFCLISGGLIFMLSSRNVIEAIEYYELDAMFTFTVAMGLTALIMAFEIVVIAIKAWAVKREARPQLAPYRFPA